MSGNTLGEKLINSFMRKRVFGVIKSHLPKPPFIIAANHTSYFDHYLLSWYMAANGLPYPKFLSKSELFDSPISAWFNKKGGGIPVARGSVDTEAFETASQVLKDGGILVVYPEGKRSPQGNLLPPRGGIALLAAKNQVPVVPIGMLGTRDVLPIGKKYPRAGKRAVLHVGQPMEPPGESRPEQKAFSSQVMRQVAQLSGQWAGFLGEMITEEMASAWSEVAATASLPMKEQLSTPLLQAEQNNERAFHLPKEEAVALFRETVQLIGHHGDLQNNPRALIELGRAYAKLADYTTSIPTKIRFILRGKKYMEIALRLDPFDAVGWHAWGTLMERLPGFLGGDPVRGMNGHRIAYALRPYWRRGALALARAYKQRKDEKHALFWAQQVEKLPIVFPRDEIRGAEAEELIAQLVEE